MVARPKIAFYWCAGCGGCEESVIDMAERLPYIAEAVEIVFWPLVMDARYSDVLALEDGEIDAVFINGAIRLHSHVEMARLLRQKSKIVYAHGSCAHMGGVIGLANQYSNQQLLDYAYQQVPSLDDGSAPFREQDATSQPGVPPLPELLPAVLPLDQVVPVDAVIPGCPPVPASVAAAIETILHGRLPEKGTFFAHRKTLCHQCERLPTRPEKMEVKRFKRLYEIQWDANVCFLPQGLLCLGPVTRGGCDARCLRANMPCRGCYGPTERVDDFGAGAMAMIAACMGGTEATELNRAVRSIVDPLGFFYRYCLAASILGTERAP